MTETNATAATVADIVDPFQFMEQGLFVVEIRVLPVDRVARRCLQTPFPMCLCTHGNYLNSLAHTDDRAGHDPALC